MHCPDECTSAVKKPPQNLFTVDEDASRFSYLLRYLYGVFVSRAVCLPEELLCNRCTLGNYFK